MKGQQQEIGQRSSPKGEGQDEAPESSARRIELFMVKDARESLGSERLLEEVIEQRNIYRALHRVIANRGAPGIDGVTVDELPALLKRDWETIEEQLLKATYRRQPVK